MARRFNMIQTRILAFCIGTCCILAIPAMAAESTKKKKEKVKGPDVVLIESKNRSIQEYRQNGRLTSIKVVPKKGKPYYMVPEDPTKHFGDLERAERLVPKWTIKEF